MKVMLLLTALICIIIDAKAKTVGDEKLEDLVEELVEDEVQRELAVEKRGLPEPVFVSATASSIYKDDTNNYGPALAWSGGSTTSMGFFSSKNEDNPWLQIRLKPLKINGVTIINRKDCCGDRMRNLEVRAGMSEGLANEVQGTFKGPGVKGGEYKIAFTKPVMTEYITFQLKHKGYLQMNGIKVHPAPVSLDEKCPKPSTCDTCECGPNTQCYNSRGKAKCYCKWGYKEENGVCKKLSCVYTKFTCCGNGKCINHEKVCDGKDDCEDNKDNPNELSSDEKHCNNEKNKCQYYQFRCNNGKCLHSMAKCNGKNDCGDNSDEACCFQSSR